MLSVTPIPITPTRSSFTPKFHKFHKLNSITYLGVLSEHLKWFAPQVYPIQLSECVVCTASRRKENKKKNNALRCEVPCRRKRWMGLCETPPSKTPVRFRHPRSTPYPRSSTFGSERLRWFGKAVQRFYAFVEPEPHILIPHPKPPFSMPPTPHMPSHPPQNTSTPTPAPTTTRPPFTIPPFAVPSTLPVALTMTTLPTRPPTARLRPRTRWASDWRLRDTIRVPAAAAALVSSPPTTRRVRRTGRAAGPGTGGFTSPDRAAEARITRFKSAFRAKTSSARAGGCVSSSAVSSSYSTTAEESSPPRWLHIPRNLPRCPWTPSVSFFRHDTSPALRTCIVFPQPSTHAFAMEPMLTW